MLVRPTSLRLPDCAPCAAAGLPQPNRRNSAKLLGERRTYVESKHNAADCQCSEFRGRLVLLAELLAGNRSSPTARRCRRLDRRPGGRLTLGREFLDARRLRRCGNGGRPGRPSPIKSAAASARHGQTLVGSPLAGIETEPSPAASGRPPERPRGPCRRTASSGGPCMWSMLTPSSTSCSTLPGNLARRGEPVNAIHGFLETSSACWTSNSRTTSSRP